jgi:hypothetical protein
MITVQMCELKHTKCPECGSQIKGVSQDSQHTNGHWFESMTFRCGCIIKFIPNFMKTEFYHACPNTPSYKHQQERRDAALMKLKKYIMKMDVDEEMKEDILFGVRSTGARLTL